MPKTRFAAPSRAIGHTLKRWREERGLSLRAVENASKAHFEPIGFDYLSRLERGELMPSVPKLSTLAAVYERPISELVDLYEIEQFRRLVPKRASYATCRELGIKNLEKGLITKALAFFLGAVDAAQREGADRQKMGVAHNNAASAMIRGGRYLTARHYLDEGLRHAENPHTRARLLDNLAIAYYHLDNLTLADLCSREACAMGSNDEVLRPITQGTRAAVLLDMKRYAEAEPLMREALETYRKSGKEMEEIRWLYNLGHCLVEQGRLDEGLMHLRTAAARAVERADPDLRAKSLFFFGRSLYRSDRKEDSVLPLSSALRLARDHDLRNEAFHSAYYLWMIARETGNRAEETQYAEVAQHYRTRLQQRSEEREAFDFHFQGKPSRRKVSIGSVSLSR